MHNTVALVLALGLSASAVAAPPSGRVIYDKGWTRGDPQFTAWRNESSGFYYGPAGHGVLETHRDDDGGQFLVDTCASLEGEDFVIEARLRQQLDQPGSWKGYGIYWGVTATDFSGGESFQVDDGGKYEVARWRKAQRSVVRPWSTTPSIHKANATNTLRVEKIGARYRFLVNGQLVDEAPYAPLAGSRIGVITSGRASVEVQRLQVWLLAKPETQPSSAGEVGGDVLGDAPAPATFTWKELSRPFDGMAVHELIGGDGPLYALLGAFPDRGESSLALAASDDGGLTWRRRSSVARLAKDPVRTDGRVLVALRDHLLHLGPQGLARSEDGGRTWARVEGVPHPDAATPGHLGRTGNIFLYAIGEQLFESYDRGSTWKKKAPLPGPIDALIATDVTVFAQLAGLTYHRLDKNGWTPIEDLIWAGASRMVIDRRLPPFRVSTDRGKTWRPVVGVEAQMLVHVAGACRGWSSGIAGRCS